MTLLVVPATGVGEVRPGDDLAALLAVAWRGAGVVPQDGDVVAVTSKVVSKAEGRLVAADADAEDPRAEAVAAETDRVVAVRGRTRIVRTRHGFVMAAAGVDASNVETGTLVLLPLDPDGSARALREALSRHWGANVAVVLTDTAGRAWRAGQTDLAMGAAGLVVLDDHGGRADAYGNPLVVTAPAVADEVASAAELATGKLSHSPAALVRGLDAFVLPAGDHGPGAAALVRAEDEDLFGLGAREAVLTALEPGRAGARGFGAPATPEELGGALARVLGTGARLSPGEDGWVLEVPPGSDRLLAAVLLACGWAARSPYDAPGGLRVGPASRIGP
ncbi:coenzyme F420-0:L-glutamate ligase [Nocardioides marmoribigeumensis]|uniref:Coenzyme F420-0:L-glutamate ligase/coenzyme F420-1:gamma-L-glutamate ligase n=1 Tax=Nocardioides marmoribigeumensis TaxID=433649 RepID=A0ABU2C018_9ACTN|nr:coenzyme F420-0:L-glutamate ligase [Nocardioides marmoribigeumensis]MDR7364012.1 coenzyme F420-0:L-glutamate ligase/coenzyme F420-1:gamma-L-glutamate ligase [Nocardioides marmoribigeumensis]